jgi:hypothetical protein
VPCVRTVKTASGATAVQVVWSRQARRRCRWSSWRGSRQIEHLRSVHDATELEALKAASVPKREGDQASW